MVANDNCSACEFQNGLDSSRRYDENRLERNRKPLGRRVQHSNGWRGGSEPNLFKHVGLEAREIPAVGEVFSLDFPLYRTSSFRRCSVASFSRNVDSVRCHKLRVRNFRPKFDTLQSGLLFGFTEKRQQVLMSEPARQILEEWGEGNGVAEAQEIGFSSGLAGYLRKIVLTPVESPEGMPIVAHTSRVDGVNNDARTLSLLNRRIHVRIGRAHTSESVYAIRDYKNF